MNKHTYKKIIIGIVIILVAWLILFFRNIILYTTPTKITTLGKKEKSMLADEFEIPNLCTKIEEASYVTESLKIKVGPFDSLDDELGYLSFADDENYKENLKNMVDIDAFELYENINGETFKAYSIDGLEAEYSFAKTYEENGHYYLELDKNFVRNKQIVNIFS